MPKSQSAPRVAALIGPYMSGKTTLFESLLHATDAIPRKGTIKEGNTVGDASPEAKARQMSVEISVASATYLGEAWTFIDCPGSVEFAQEAMNALMVADAAVLVVEADPGRAAMCWPILKFLDDHNIPHSIFLNKVDNLTEAGKIRATLDALQPMSQHPLVLREYPISAGSFITGYEDLSLERAFKANPGHPSEQIEIPESIKDEAMAARQEMLEAIANLDDALMEKLLEEQVPSRDEVFATLTKGFRTDQIVPVLLGSADKDLGVRRLLKQLRHEAPEVKETAARLGIPTEGSEPLAQVWKTLNAQHIGKQSLVRIWRGELTEGMTLNGTRPSSLTHSFGAKQEKVAKAGPGEIVALGRMDTVKTGDVLVAGNKPVTLDWPAPMQPMTALALKTTKMGDEVKLSGALAKLVDEDQSYRLDQNAETQERVLWGQGEIHLKVAIDRIKRWGVEVALSAPAIPYFAQTQLDKPHDYVVYIFDERTPQHGGPPKKTTIDMHAGESETSKMLIARPDLVHLDRAKNESGADQARQKLAEDVYTGIWWYTRFPNHYSGDGSVATKELGEFQMKWWIDSVVKAIREVKADDVSLKLQNEFYERSTHPLDTQP